jgi:chaperone required for assembly of F1-ATPase
VKRFFATATTDRREGGFAVLLDGRAMLTPARNALMLPSLALAGAIAAEWSAQGDEIEAATMPLTRHAYTAVDGVRQGIDQVVEEITRFAETDLVCYRADSPKALATQQAAAWQPLLDWLHEAHGTSLAVTNGVVPIRQSPEQIAVLKRLVAAHDLYVLTALHTLVSISGSLVIGLAVSAGRLDAIEAWEVSRIDHDYQAAQWGTDSEAAADAIRTRSDLVAAARFMDLARAKTAD